MIAEKQGAATVAGETAGTLPPDKPLTKAELDAWAAKFPTRSYNIQVDQNTFKPYAVLLTASGSAMFGSKPIETRREVQL